MLANIHPVTGIHYGVISFSSIKPEWLQSIYDNGTNVSYDEARAEFIKELAAEGIGEDHDDYEDRLQAWSDGYESDGDVYCLEEGEGDQKLELLTSSLGLYVLHSPKTTQATPCSPCCPNAGDLDSAGENAHSTWSGGPYTTYDLPFGWRNGEPDLCAWVATQCTARNGQVGSFLFEGDITNPEKLLMHSPVFSSLAELYPWAKENGWTTHPDAVGNIADTRMVK